VADDWRAAADAAYRKYAIYEAGGGAEQKVASVSGLQSRSKVIVERLAQREIMPASGTWLDFGCGNGGFLRAFAERFPSWQLEGAETDQRHLPELESIAGFRRLHGVDARQLRGRYEGVSLVHVLEHIATPSPVLVALRERTIPGGLLFVEVPSWRANPFALMISDHASHFTPATLQMVVNASGWTSEAACQDWVPKELSLVARNGGQDAAAAHLNYDEEKDALHSAVRWLVGVMTEAQQVASESANFGLFGSAIAATWLYQGMTDRVRFFVDEDPHRVGRTHLGLPIISPAEVPADADVFVGVGPVIADALLARLRSRPGHYHATGQPTASGIAAVC
jgi:SAM-dependent methyltransferase